MHDSTSRAGPRAWNLFSLAIAVGICVATLVPAERTGAPTELGVAPPALADALRNFALFAPLALTLVRAGHRNSLCLVLCTGLSVGIELAQLGIPGRFGTLGDVACNGLGAGLALALFANRQRWLAPRGGMAIGLRVIAVAIPWIAVLATGLLFAAKIPRGLYYGGWNAEFGGMDIYPGPVLEARVGPVEIARAGPVSESAALHRALHDGEPLHVRWQVAEPPARLSPLVVLIGPGSEELVLVATRKADLVLRRWRLAADFRLEQPELTWPGADSALAHGAVAELIATPRGAGVVAQLEGGPSRVIGLGPGRGWALLAPDRWVAPWLRPSLDALWLALLLLPLGLWLPQRGWFQVSLAAAALAALWLAPGPLGLAPAVPVEWAGAGVGLLAGLGFRVRWHSGAR